MKRLTHQTTGLTDMEAGQFVEENRSSIACSCPIVIHCHGPRRLDGLRPLGWVGGSASRRAAEKASRTSLRRRRLRKPLIQKAGCTPETKAGQELMFLLVPETFCGAFFREGFLGGEFLGNHSS